MRDGFLCVLTFTRNGSEATCVFMQWHVIRCEMVKHCTFPIPHARFSSNLMIHLINKIEMMLFFYVYYRLNAHWYLIIFVAPKTFIIMIIHFHFGNTAKTRFSSTYTQRNVYFSSQIYFPFFLTSIFDHLKPAHFPMGSVIYVNEWVVEKARIGNEILREARGTTTRRPLQLARIWLQSIGFTRFRFVILWW